MTGPGLPTSIVELAPGHLGHTNTVHGIVNKFDTTIGTVSDGQVLAWDTVSSSYRPHWPSPTKYVNVKDPIYGAVGDGTTDDSAAFAAAYAAAASAVVANSGVSGEANLRGRVVIALPAGRYKLTTDNAMMAATSGSRVYGITYEGAGPGLTEILWQPAASGKSLFRNNDIWLGVNIKGISFLAATAGSRWFYSSSTGGAQNYLIEDCSWNGTWEYGLGLDGTNCNSEFTFRRPWVDGSYSAAFFWIGMTAATSAQDQFVNYSFYDPSVFLDTGDTFIRADYGGAIRLFGGNYIVNGALLYDLRNNTHGRAAESFIQVGGRIELRSSTSKVIDCKWGRGQVTFNTIDEESQVDVVSQTVTTHSYKPGNNDGPGIAYQNCKLSGRHEYGYSSNNFQRERRVIYDNCETHDEPHLFIVNTDEGSGNVGGYVKAEFRRHRTRLYEEFRVYDQITNWQTATLAEPQRRSATFRTAFGGLPSNSSPSVSSVDLWLPMGAVVTAVRFYKPSGGAATNTNWTYDVKTSEGSPTTLGSAAGGGSVQWTTGFNEVDTVNNFVCDSDAKRHLVLSTTNVTGDAGPTSFVLVEYIA